MRSTLSAEVNAMSLAVILVAAYVLISSTLNALYQWRLKRIGEGADTADTDTPETPT